MNGLWRRFLVTLGLGFCSLGPLSWALPVAALARDAPLASNWVAGHKARTRLTAGRVVNAGKPPGQLYAFVEIELAEGWKTYWRSPGDSGIPPHFEFGKSTNLAKAEVLYPAPKRIAGKGETIIGYTGIVIFPVALTAADPTLPIELAARVQFGMCKDICVPTEAALTLSVAADAPPTPAGPAQEAIDRVPVVIAVGAKTLPVSVPHLISVLSGLKPAADKLSITADFPQGTAGADAFLEAPDGLYLPLLAQTAATGTSVTFEADISKDVDLAALTGKIIGITLVSDAGASATSFKFE